jgi:hypothetical protein
MREKSLVARKHQSPVSVSRHLQHGKNARQLLHPEQVKGRRRLTACGGAFDNWETRCRSLLKVARDRGFQDFARCYNNAGPAVSRGQSGRSLGAAARASGAGSLILTRSGERGLTRVLYRVRFGSMPALACTPFPAEHTVTINAFIVKYIRVIELIGVLMRISSFSLVSWLGPSSPFLFVWVFNTTDAVMLSWCAILKRDLAYSVLNVFWVIIGIVGILRAGSFVH